MSLKFIISIAASVVLLLCFSGLFYFVYQVSKPAKSPGEEIIFLVKPGKGVKEIADDLGKAGLIRSSFIFQVYVWLKDLEKELQAGEYALSSHMSLKEIVDFLSFGRVLPREIEIKIIEGWTAQDIGEYLTRMGVLRDNEEFLAVVDKIQNSKFKMQNYEFLTDKPDKASLEGYLFPDTYKIYKDAKPEDIVLKMLDNFGRKLTLAMLKDIEKQGRTIFEIVTLASVIEAEVPHFQDRPIVAGIFYKRLKAGIPLQADSTVNYVTGVKKRALSYEETQIDSPYNSYKYPGLPRGPISNPGLSALLGAIYPQDSEYWYFLSKEDGETVFSRTLEEHNQNKTRWLK